MKFPFFGASSESLRNPAWTFSLILLLLATDFLTFSISLLMMANSAHYVFCLSNDSVCLKNSWYLCWQHVTDFNRLFVIENDCGKRLWLFIWSMINLQKVINFWCTLTLRTLLFTLNPLSTAAWPWLNTDTVPFQPCLTSQ